MGRRERILETMGLGPVWRQRVGTEDALITTADDHSSAARDHAISHAEAPAAIQRDDRSERIAALDWPALEESVRACDACKLCTTRTNAVFGVGDHEADWLIVGEAPGAEEDARGEPFVGQAGRLLDNMLAAIDLKRGEKVYIANVLKCRPPGNRNPEPGEVAQCEPYLRRQIALLQPRIIIAMGRFAAQTLLATDASISSLRGRLFQYRDVPLVVTYHPAYLLRTLPDKSKAWDDLLFARRTMRSLKTSKTAAM